MTYNPRRTRYINVTAKSGMRAQDEALKIAAERYHVETWDVDGIEQIDRLGRESRYVVTLTAREDVVS